MKDIEKIQTKPTTAMLQALLEQEEPKKNHYWWRRNEPQETSPITGS